MTTDPTWRLFEALQKHMSTQIALLAAASEAQLAEIALLVSNIEWRISDLERRHDD